MDYRELWKDPGFMELVIDYIEAQFARCQDWTFEIAVSDRAALATESHKIAGAAGMYGFSTMGDTAGALEEAIRIGLPEELICELFQELKSNVATARDEARQYIADDAL